MNVLWIFAHPEGRSLNASLKEEGVKALAELGHEVRESDLYAMGWNPVVDHADFGQQPDGRDRLLVGAEQEQAFVTGRLSEDIRAEQEKLAWADAVVFHFPMWWFGPPAIMKGWFDRVLVQGFAFGLKDGNGRTLRYGAGGLEGKRGLVITSVGARESGFGPRGIHGHVDDVLFPLLHGTFFYTGMDAMPPMVVYGADRLDDRGYEAAVEELRRRLEELCTAEPVPFRPEGGEDYDEDLVLRPHLAPGRTGLGVHHRHR
jgi:NAD(P)H dehydrogenase (quinone)